MLTTVTEYEYNQALRRVRIFLLSTFLCCLTYYFVLINIDSTHLDFLPGRLFVCFLSVLGLVASFVSQRDKYKWGIFYLRFASIAFLVLYLYLLHINNWSLFYCWSYFILAAILSSSAINWQFYLVHATLGFVAPLIMGFYSPLTPLELFHFHSANLVVFALIGISVYNNFLYKREVARLTKDLIEQSKMAALGEMAGGISHEINNPLAIIKGAIEHLKRVPPSAADDVAKFDNLTDKISRMVLRITKITNGLKEFSQDNTDQNLEMHDLNDIIDDGIRLCMRKFKDSEVDITFHPTDTSLCLCKKNQITQIILNLCTNSVEATISKLAPQITITLSREKDYYIISIVDNGVGIAENQASKIMEPFFTTKEVGHGLGLGLSAAHGFAKVHGGELHHEPMKELTRFNLKLPIPHNHSIQE